MGGGPRGGAHGGEGAGVNEGVYATDEEVHRVHRRASHGCTLQRTSSTSITIPGFVLITEGLIAY